MTGPFIHSEELDDLLSALRDDQLTDPQNRRLEALLTADRAARLAYLEYILLWANLEKRSISEPLAPRSASKNPGSPSGGSRPRSLSFLTRFALAALLVFAFTYAIAALFSIATRRTSSTSGESLATLTDAQNAVWDNSKLAPGDRLPSGWFHLRSGTATLAFVSGAEVTLTGPAELGLNSPMRAFLRRGKLRAYCPSSAHGFTVAAPGCAVVDLGTRFDLTVDDAGTSQMHVLQGKVNLQINGQSSRVIESGSVVQVSAKGNLLGVEVASANESISGSSVRDDDPDLLMHYTFDRVDLNSAIVPDRSISASSAKWLGGTLVPGRLPGTSAIHLSKAGDGLGVSIPNNPPALTLAGWFRIGPAENRCISLFATAGFHFGNCISWLIDRDGKLKFNGGDRSFVLDTQLPRNQWIHLAVVYDGIGKTLTAYRDGKVVSQTRLGHALWLARGSAQIGDWDNAGIVYYFPDRHFVGDIQEFAVWKRALTGREIRDLASSQAEADNPIKGESK